MWAKSYLFNVLFGKLDEEDGISHEPESKENAEQMKNMRREAQALKQMRESVGQSDASRNIFDTVFKSDIHRLLEMEDLWKDRQKPTPLIYNDLKNTLKEAKDKMADRKSIKFDQTPWNLEENLIMFLERFNELIAVLIFWVGRY